MLRDFLCDDSSGASDAPIASTETASTINAATLVTVMLETPKAIANAEALPFPDDHFDCVSVAFGLRNMTRKEAALAEMRRVLRPGGRVLVLEFSRIARPLEKPYDWYSFHALPWLGKRIAGDEESYRYLAESIRMHPDQQALKDLMKNNGFSHVDIHNMTAGVVALHVGIKT